jgi:hypothetical protein
MLHEGSIPDARIPNRPFTLKVSRKHAHEGRPAYGTGRGVGDRVMRRPSSRKACSGEFGSNSQTYAGTGTIRYTW